MRFTLRSQITTLLLLFGIVPAAIVAMFGYVSAEDFKTKQGYLMKQAAWNASDRIRLEIENVPPEPSKGWSGVIDQHRQRILTILNDIVEQFALGPAQVLVADSDRVVHVKRSSTGEIDQSTRAIPPKYSSKVGSLDYGIVRALFSEQHAGYAPIPATPQDPPELVGYSPLQLPSGPDKKTYGILVTLPRAEAYATIYTFQTWTALILLACLGLTILLGIFLGGRFVKPLHEIMQVTHELQEGNLHNKTHVQRHDELGKLAEQVNSLVDKLSGVIAQIRIATSSVSTASGELNSSAQQLSQGATEQAGTLQQIVSSLESVNASVKRNAQHAKDTSRTANHASAQAEKGGEAVQETVAAMRQIAQKISVVEDIAYQTNLLALNAAIEAARAGQQGKGFAVVATEVRKLAERSQAAAQQIAELADSSVAVAENAGQLLEKIVPMIRDTSNLVQEIAAASQEQMAAISQINVGVSQLNEVVQQNAAASHQLATTSSDLAWQASTLQHYVEYFRVDLGGNGASAPAPPPHAPAPPPPRQQAPPLRLQPPAPRAGTAAAPADGHGLPHHPPAHAHPSGREGEGPGGPGGGHLGNSQHGNRGIVVNLDDDVDFERF
jgi:methyl-accepting chemotaxis protein